jgi:hypothetical protein
VGRIDKEKKGEEGSALARGPRTDPPRERREGEKAGVSASRWTAQGPDRSSCRRLSGMWCILLLD